MPTPPVSSLKSSSGSKGSSSEDCSPRPFVSSLEGRASFLRSSWISRLIPELPLPISWAKGPPRSAAGAEDEDTDNKRLSLSPFFQYQRQLASNFLGNGRVDVPPSSSSSQVDIRPAKALGLVKPMATSSSAQHVARRTGVDSAARQERAKDPAAITTFGDNVQSNKRQSPGCPSEEEEPFSFWNMGRSLDERSNYVSSAAPVRSLDMAHGKKRTLHSYELVSSKYRKRGSED
ncbi:uncharacterized protein M6B38_415910 [Iris pallida]|uniref:Uncharacterized protein n=1 Tax=Iris pallida TaxID=29817 RepID=A0AAX6FKC1_IRIPA|nr:uncharacterized protein M6B38_415910 [Iris pallida]